MMNRGFLFILLGLAMCIVAGSTTTVAAVDEEIHYGTEISYYDSLICKVFNDSIIPLLRNDRNYLLFGFMRIIDDKDGEHYTPSCIIISDRGDVVINTYNRYRNEEEHREPLYKITDYWDIDEFDPDDSSKQILNAMFLPSIYDDKYITSSTQKPTWFSSEGEYFFAYVTTYKEMKGRIRLDVCLDALSPFTNLIQLMRALYYRGVTLQLIKKEEEKDK